MADERAPVKEPQGTPLSTDLDLVMRVREGDPDAFETLVRRHLPRAHAVATSVLRDEDQADDVCQEAFLAVLRRLEQLRDPERFLGWLLRITRNIALNQLKREGRSVLLPLESLENYPGEDDPDEMMREKGVQDQLRDAVAHLSGLPKRVFILHELEGWDHGEIADELGISKGSSRVHLYLARRTLRARVARPVLEEA